jgi:phosphoribosylformimino-5-aminoimidazole carboxamide ribotide isomerase
MELYPAIDLYQGKAVRLKGGDFNQVTVYSEHPEEMALAWKKAGTHWIHVVDLEGAKSGRIVHGQSIQKIRASVPECKIEVGGGVRKLEDIQSLIDFGADRVILGTKALDKDFLELAVKRFNAQIAVGLDTRQGKVQLEGWLTESGVSLEQALQLLEPYQIKTLIVTDIATDGMLMGPNFNQLESVLTKTRSRVILSGGVSSLEDLRRAAMLKFDNFEGVIIGKALYEKRFTLEDAVKIAHKGEGVES